VLGGIAVWLFAPDAVDLQLRHAVLWTAAAALLLLVRWGALRAGTGGAPSARGVVSGGLAGVAIVAFVTWLVFHAPARATPHIRLRRGEWDWYQLSAQATAYDRALLAALFACAVFAAAEYFLARSARPRALGLVTTAFLALALRVLLPYLPLDAFSIFHSSAAVTLATFALVWVVGLGWMADPNMVSLHTFYKARLVRAYMGASNPDRATRQITEAVHGDDILVKDLENCARGGPYHLVNTTLNLVGGRDLTTEQRSADHFVFSKLFCGSSRTGYRKTSAYMNGKLTLGTAVAASGAAASPNMGSKTPSAALSMLMAFLNVRLAFWAPTPSMNRWKEAQPRLWPFYLLRECLSQTNDLSPYCCLSDGGHFDNTGIYALAARGCRHIVVADCGARPHALLRGHRNGDPAVPHRLRGGDRAQDRPVPGQRAGGPGALRRRTHHLHTRARECSGLAPHGGPGGRRDLDQARPHRDGRARGHPPVRAPEQGLPAADHRRPVVRRGAVRELPPPGGTHCPAAIRGSHDPR
jgi:hypothetical protein